MDSLHETVIFPDRPLFLTHRKKPGKPGTIDLSPANLNGVLAGTSFRSRPTFQVQNQPCSTAAQKASLSQYRKIKFIDNNVPDITKRRSARPRQVKSKHLHSNTKPPRKGLLAGVPKSSSSDSTGPDSENDVAVDETIDDFVRAVTHANPARSPGTALAVITPHGPQHLYTDNMSKTIRNFVPHMLGYCKTFLLSAINLHVF
jgi:hypothetical protein